MNTAKLKQSGVENLVEGMGFSIPTSIMVPIIESIMRGEAIRRPFLGIRAADLSDEYRAEHNIDDRLTGALIETVFIGSAAEAGLLPGDIIIGFDGRPIIGKDSLLFNVNMHRPNDTVTLRVLRAGEILEIIVIIGTEV
jgi:S1-C subfamily serine protease